MWKAAGVKVRGPVRDGSSHQVCWTARGGVTGRGISSPRGHCARKILLLAVSYGF